MSSLIKKIRTFFKVNFIKKYSTDLKKYSDEEYNQRLFKITFGRKGDFKNPKTFNEHVIALKLYADESGFERYTDKYEVREYVKSVVGEKYLNEVIAVYDTAEDIDFSVLPKSFVLKATHGSGFNVIVREKSAINESEVKSRFKTWLSRNYYYVGRERNYKNIVPRIVCEKFLDTADGKPLNEVKLFCIDGKVKLISDNRVYNGVRCDNLYDENKGKLDLRWGMQNHAYDLPDNIDEMISVAEKLAKQFRFVRVDLYDLGGRIIFSELTFHSGGGLVPFSPKEWDEKLGKLFDK